MPVPVFNVLFLFIKIVGRNWREILLINLYLVRINDFNKGEKEEGGRDITYIYNLVESERNNNNSNEMKEENLHILG